MKQVKSHFGKSKGALVDEVIVSSYRPEYLQETIKEIRFLIARVREIQSNLLSKRKNFGLVEANVVKGQLNILWKDEFDFSVYSSAVQDAWSETTNVPSVTHYLKGYISYFPDIIGLNVISEWEQGHA